MNDNRPTPAVSPSFNAAIDKAVPGFAAELAKQQEQIAAALKRIHGTNAQ